MRSEPNKELEAFAYRFFERRGAVLEKNENGFEALLPQSLSDALNTSEHIHINSGEHAGGQGYSVNYGSELLEKMIDAACRGLPLLAYRFEVDYLKKEGFERLVADQFKFFNAVGKIENQAETKTEYLFLTCRYTAQSDEQKHGLLNFVFNMETGAFIPGMAELVFAPGNIFTQLKHGFPDNKPLKGLIKNIKLNTQLTLKEELHSFYESMTRRFKRDASNLEEYYAALKKEMQKNLKRHALSQKLVQERRQKMDLLPAELERKRSDLYKKYSIRVHVEPCAGVWIHTPAVQVIYQIMVGRKRDSISFTYNPITRALDPLVCQGCANNTTNIFFCDHLHLLDQSCSSKCPLCQKNHDCP